MKTLICDLDETTRHDLAIDERFDVVIGRETLEGARPCMGCFGCWTKTPGRCVIKDPLAELGPLLAVTSELAIVSRMSFGGYSGLVKRAVDRCIPFIHPCFRIVDGEMHHRRRHGNSPRLSSWLYGPSTSAERDIARRIVRANAGNLGAELRGLWFPASPEEMDLLEASGGDEGPSPAHELPLGHCDLPARPPRTVTLLSASPKGRASASWTLLDDLAQAAAALARSAGATPPQLTLKRIPPTGSLSDVRPSLSADALVIAYPLYVDGLPSGLVSALEELAASGGLARTTSVYAVGNLGFHEAHQLLPSFAIIRDFCEKTGLAWRGGVAVGGGGMIVPTRDSARMGMLRRPVSEAVDQLAVALVSGSNLGVVKARCPLPRPIYRLVAEKRWKKAARESGVDLDETPLPSEPLRL